MRSIFIGLLILFVAINTANAQEKKDKDPKTKEKAGARENSYQPDIKEDEPNFFHREEKIKKKRKDKGTSYADWYFKNLEEAREEFYERLEDNARRDRKIRRKMQHPRYHDFSYFGHKKKPKIRPVGKRKLCKECGIVH